MSKNLSSLLCFPLIACNFLVKAWQVVIITNHFGTYFKVLCEFVICYLTFGSFSVLIIILRASPTTSNFGDSLRGLPTAQTQTNGQLPVSDRSIASSTLLRCHSNVHTTNQSIRRLKSSDRQRPRTLHVESGQTPSARFQKLPTQLNTLTRFVPARVRFSPNFSDGQRLGQCVAAVMAARLLFQSGQEQHWAPPCRSVGLSLVSPLHWFIDWCCLILCVVDKVS